MSAQDLPQDSLVNNVIVAAALSPAFATVFVALRFYTARTVIRRFHKDDWLILVGLIFSIGFSITEIIQSQYGLGLHIWNVPDERATFKVYMLLSAFPTSITNNGSGLFIKWSILEFYLRFSTSRAFNITVYSILFVVVAYNLTAVTGILYFCRPIRRFWTFEPGTCWDANAWYGILIGLSAFTDVLLLILPIWILRPLRIGFGQRAALFGILGTGGFVCGVSILRLVIVIEGFDDDDYTHRFAINYIWAIVETNVAIICACLPCLKALAPKVLPWCANHLKFGRQTIPLQTISVSHLTENMDQNRHYGVSTNDGSNSLTTSTESSQCSGLGLSWTLSRETDDAQQFEPHGSSHGV